MSLFVSWITSECIGQPCIYYENSSKRHEPWHTQVLPHASENDTRVGLPPPGVECSFQANPQALCQIASSLESTHKHGN
jgi:hypothetical protein